MMIQTAVRGDRIVAIEVAFTQEVMNERALR
jgi:hypothetical protein